MLIEVKDDVNATDMFGKTTLMCVSLQVHKDGIQILIEAKTDVNATDNILGKTALIWTSEKGHKEIVKILKET